MNIIKCVICREEKTEENFRIFRNRRNKSCDTCRDTNNKWYAKDLDGRRTRQKKWYQDNFQRVKVYRFNDALKRKYGITLEVFNSMIQTQNNACAICNMTFDRNDFKKYPQVDHCHKTKKVRGLLCRTCNLTVLPAIEKYSNRFEKAQLYLKSMK